MEYGHLVPMNVLISNKGKFQRVKTLLIQTTRGYNTWPFKYLSLDYATFSCKEQSAKEDIVLNLLYFWVNHCKKKTQNKQVNQNPKLNWTILREGQTIGNIFFWVKMRICKWKWMCVSRLYAAVLSFIHQSLDSSWRQGLWSRAQSVRRRTLESPMRLWPRLRRQH